MILTDVYIPSIDDSYDFMLDENVPVEQIITEISEMVSKKVQGRMPENGTGFMMCSMDKNEILDRNQTLHGNGIRDGSRLMLV